MCNGHRVEDAAAFVGTGLRRKSKIGVAVEVEEANFSPARGVVGDDAGEDGGCDTAVSTQEDWKRPLETLLCTLVLGGRANGVQHFQCVGLVANAVDPFVQLQAIEHRTLCWRTANPIRAAQIHRGCKFAASSCPCYEMQYCGVELSFQQDAMLQYQSQATVTLQDSPYCPRREVVSPRAGAPKLGVRQVHERARPPLPIFSQSTNIKSLSPRFNRESNYQQHLYPIRIKMKSLSAIWIISVCSSPLFCSKAAIRSLHQRLTLNFDSSS